MYQSTRRLSTTMYYYSKLLSIPETWCELLLACNW